MQAAAAVRETTRQHRVTDHVIAIVRPDNLASQGVARNIGLQLERTAHTHGGESLIFGAGLDQGFSQPVAPARPRS